MSIKILKPGICSTIQDLGRTGYRSLGIGPGGAMDFFAATTANYLAGNDEQQPVIEMHFPAATICFKSNSLISIAGANFDAHINEVPVEMYQPLFVEKNAVLSFKKNISGARVYLAIQKGMEVEKWLGSYSTHLKITAGGYKGRLLQKDDIISINTIAYEFNRKKIKISPAVLETLYKKQSAMRCIAGPQWHLLHADSEKRMLQSALTISNQSDRMGYRLTGENCYLQTTVELISAPVTVGTVQLLPDGQLIILMADHQTTGGYPNIATVIAADLPRLSQLPVNSQLHFQLVSLQHAEEMLLSIHQLLSEIKTGCQNFYEKH